MAKMTPLELEPARQLAGRFGISLDRLDAIEAGSVNSNFRLWDTAGKPYFARIYEEQGTEGAKADVRLLGELGVLGVPCAAPVLTLDGEFVVDFEGKPFSITEWVDGEVLCHRLTGPRELELVGQALGKVHALSPRFVSIPEGRFGPAELEQRLDFIEENAEPELVEAARDIRQRLRAVIAKRDGALPQGLTHGDLFRDNVLWQGGEVSALIDFESACRGPFAFDVMVCIEAWCFTDAFVPELVEAFLRGYVSERPLSDAESLGLSAEGVLCGLRFATTRITDFSMRTARGATPKRDYRRFLARADAIEAGVLDPIVEAVRKQSGRTS
jgi:homoserine kinase type II